MRNKHLLSKVLLLVAVMLAGVGTAWGETVEWDLSKASYDDNATADKVTWSSDFVSMVLTKGSSQTSANNYLGGSNYYTHTRVYKDQVLTWTPAQDITISSIVITSTASSYTSGLKDGTWTNGSATSSETTITVTPTAGTSAVSCVIKAAARATKVVVTYTAAAASPLASIALSGDYPTSFYVGDAFSHEGMKVTATYEDASTQDVTGSASFSGYDMSTTGSQTVTVSYTAGEVTKTATYGITVNAIPTYTVTLPDADKYGTYTMDATNPVAYGTTVTLTYTPAEGYESYQATWYVNGEEITGNSFTMPNEAVTVTALVKYVEDFVMLPFSWEGGSSSDLIDILGINANGLGSDYASSHDPYLVKFDNTGDYIQIKTDSQPGVVTIGVKMIGGAEVSSITVQGSADGETFTDVEKLEIKGSQNAELELKTKNAFAANVRYVRLLFTKGSNVGVGPISISKPSTDTAIEAAETVELEAEATYVEIAYSIVNPVSGTSLTASKNVDWITSITVADGKVTFTTTVNEGEEREGMITLTYGTLTHEVTVTQAAPVQIVSYTLATAVVPGRHYIIVGESKGEYQAMGQQKQNNRAAVDINVSDRTASVASNAGACEFVIDVDDAFTIYDPTYTTETTVGGYLYAASGSSNHLKTEAEHDGYNNSKWTISIDEDGVATIKALGTNGRNLMRYNSSGLFACYASGQNDVYLYERVGDQGGHEVTKTVSIAQACTDGEKYYATYSSPFAFTVPNDVTASEIAVADGVLTVTDYDASAVIPANTGVMLSSATAGEKTITYANGGTALTEDNCLRPSMLGITADKMSSNDANSKFYRLTMHNGEQIGFWWGAADGAAFAVAANKAYLAVPNSAAGVRQGFAFGAEATGIATLQTAAGQQPVYNLQGQRVAQPQKGLYIVNGKKVLNK